MGKKIDEVIAKLRLRPAEILGTDPEGVEAFEG